MNMFWNIITAQTLQECYEEVLLEYILLEHL